MTSPEPNKPHDGPTRRRRFPWRGVAVGVVVVVAGAAGALATFPRWGDSLVQGMAQTRLERLAGAPVTIASLDVVDFDSVAVRGVEVALGEGATLQIDHVDVGLDRAALWSGQVVVQRVEVSGGRLVGDGPALKTYARDLRTRLQAREGGGEGRVKLVPPRVRIDGLKLEVGDDLGGHRVDLRAVAAFDVAIADKQAKIDLTDVTLTAGERALRAARLGTSLEMSKETGGLAFPLTLAVERAATAVTPKIAVAEIGGSVTVADAAFSRVALDLVGGFSDELVGDEEHRAAAPLWSLKGDVARDFGDGTVELTMESFKLGRVPEVLAQLPVVDSEAATVGGDLKVAFAGGKAHLEGDLELAGLNVDHPVLARQPVRGLGFELALVADVDPAQRAVQIEQATLRRGPVRLELTGEFVHPEEPSGRRYRANLVMPKVRCQEFLAAIPAELIPSLQGFELKGDFEFEITANIDYSDLDALELSAKLKPETCKPVKVPQLVSATRLNGPLVHRVVMRDGSERSVDVRDGSEAFTPLDQISPHMLAAVMTTEDGGFWKHKGFITSQFRAALRRNLEAGKIRLGASTITMQMVKNVLLSHERTISRKLQEVFLTWYVEQSLSKQRIMELYLNVIEFGPGVYGVTRAAQHYFGKAPSELTPPEAAWLALMLPSPVRRHAHYCEGAPSQAYQAKLKRLLSIMHNRGRLDPETYEEWKEGSITFDTTELASKRECLAEVERLLAASSQQRSLSGLLEDSADLDDLPGETELVEASPRRPPPRKTKGGGFDEAALSVIGGLDDDAPPARAPRPQP